MSGILHRILIHVVFDCLIWHFPEASGVKELDFKELDFKELGVLGYLLGVLGYLLGVPI